MNRTQMNPSLADRAVVILSRHWLMVLLLITGIYIVVPFLAPVLMEFGATRAATVIYTIYSTQCHQLPQRSWFLFGEHFTYSVPEINAARGSTDIFTLREFVGNSSMGFKVAFSDRMISLYASMWSAALVVRLLKDRIKPLPILPWVLLMLPLGLDGVSHFVSDVLGGVAGGFRFTNDWLQILTGNAFASSFYQGDAWGSFNSLMRLASGIVAGIATIMLILPRAYGGTHASVGVAPKGLAMETR